MAEMKFKSLETEVRDGVVIGLETRELSAPISELIDYLMEKGFKYGGVWYFRNLASMNTTNIRLFRHAGIIEKAGTPNELRKKGIRVPDGLIYRGKGPKTLYRVRDAQINALEPLN